jgi:YidC/Oxa1 family membrane protein insertase
MDRNTFTGLFLIMLIVFGSFYLMKPSKQEIAKEQARVHADSIKKKLIKGKGPGPVINHKLDSALAKADSAQLKGPFGGAITGTEKFTTIENKDIRVKLTNHGGRIYSVELKNYKTFFKKPVVLFDGEQNQFGLTLPAGAQTFNTNNLYFITTSHDTTVAGKDSISVTMRLNYSATQYIDYIYTIAGEGFKVGLTVKPTGMDNVVANSNAININWSAGMYNQEKDIEQERKYSAVYYNTTENDVDYLSETKLDDSTTIADKKIEWVSFKAHFFSGALLSPEGFSKTNVSESTDTSIHTEVKQMHASMQLARNSAGVFPMAFYFSPNQYDILKSQGYNLDKQINMGWGPLKIINRYASRPLFDLLTKFFTNYGLIILLLTVVLKLILSPLTYKSYLSMAKMRVLKPEMDEIKAKVGEDNPTLLQQEYMKLYKQAGVNPLGGCLPLVLQMPIVIAFFRFFPGLFELRGQSFLWMHDLSTYDSFITWGVNLPFIGNHLSLMCVLMTISTLIYTYFNNQISGATGQMKYIGYITPIIFLGALNSYPAGLNYYYFLANMFTFLQQFLIRQMVDDKKIHAQIQENKKKPEVKKKKSGFQARMDEMMRQQQQAQIAAGKTKNGKK